MRWEPRVFLQNRQKLIKRLPPVGLGSGAWRHGRGVAEGLLASVAINVGLALVALSLFSMLKKQPGNAPVYLPRRMAGVDGAGGGVLLLGTGRFTTSFRWIRAAFRLSDDEVLRRHGLDALAVIRLFKFSRTVPSLRALASHGHARLAPPGTLLGSRGGGLGIAQQ